MNRKKLMTILTTTAIIATLTGTMLFAGLSVSAATAFTDNGVTVEGVLATDSYVLYPYDASSLTLGISKYGELINGETSPEQGLEYKGLDVFANPNVLEKDWSQGWFIDIHYVDVNDNYKRAWAFAMYTDLTDSNGIGGDWKENCTGEPNTTPTKGGRKTNVWATTDPIKVLYDGPRRFVALTKTTLYSGSGKTTDDALVSITITFVFNKDKKIVILYKDIKRLDEGKFTRKFQIEFSNRGEWDIGTTSAPPAYGYFYDDLATVYDQEYHEFYNTTVGTANLTGFDMAQMINTAGTYVGFAAFWPQLYGKMIEGTTTITRDTILTSLCTVEKNETWLALGSPADKTLNFTTLNWPAADDYLIGLGAEDDDPMVFKNGVLLLAGGVDYSWLPHATAGDRIVFATEPLDTDYITVVYKHEAHTNDMTTEADTPYVIGEWVFDLRNEEHKKQFRGVTVYGLTDRHDADDEDADPESWPGNDGVTNTIDCEVQYYLNETFNPYDLYDAVHKQEWRWVDIRDLITTTATNNITLTTGINDQLYYAVLSSEYTSLGLAAPGWTGYFVREEDTVHDDYPAESIWVNAFEDTAYTAHSKNWALLLNAGTYKELFKVTPQATTPTATAPLTLQLKDLVDFDFWYNVTVAGSSGPYMEFKVTKAANGTEAAGWAIIQAHTVNPQNTLNTWYHYTLNNIATFTSNAGGADEAFQVGAGSTAAEIAGETGVFHSWEYWTDDDKLGDYYVQYVGVTSHVDSETLIDDLSVGYLTKPSGIRYERVYNMEEDKLIPSDWDRYCSFSEKVLVDGVLIERFGYHNAILHDPYYTINFENGTIAFYHYVAPSYVRWTLPAGTHLKVLYSTIEENEKGRYEWMVVGKDAATIDSIGAGYMTEAFDSIKDIEVTMTGLDIKDTVYGTYAPYVMNGTTGTKADYRDSLGRSHLRDDWCTATPIASSNMLFSGGMRANLGTEYFNDFTMAFFTASEYVTNDTGHGNKLMALSCWDRNAYASNSTHGYAAISVYKDINGTIGFLIWGMDGQDTYYATKWFWSIPSGITAPDDTRVYSGIEYLQHENLGVTDIILRINYGTLDPIHPSVSVVEHLGTISEKPQHDCP